MFSYSGWVGWNSPFCYKKKPFCIQKLPCGFFLTNSQWMTFFPTKKIYQEEKHFVEQLQRKLRCAVRSLRAMVPLVSLKDADLVSWAPKEKLVGWSCLGGHGPPKLVCDRSRKQQLWPLCHQNPEHSWASRKVWGHKTRYTPSGIHWNP